MVVRLLLLCHLDSGRRDHTRLTTTGYSTTSRRAKRTRATNQGVRSRLGKFAQTANDKQRTLLPDVEIFAKALRFALDLNEFYDVKDLNKAKTVLQTGQARLTELKSNKPLWLRQTGSVIRGYRSGIDQSVQPYGLEIPETYDPKKPVRLVVWLHGRSDKGTDLHFIDERMKKKGEYQFPNTIILHPFGRHCNAFKFAGEVDVMESIATTQANYSFTKQRPALMGFSMGGAGCWHLAAHYPQLWTCASPGAGFVDVRRYQNLSGDKLPAWYVQQLWDWYDVPPYTDQLATKVPLLSYSGEKDAQKASADIMDEEFRQRGYKLLRVIGKDQGHKYDKPSIAAISKWVEEQFANEAKRAAPTAVSFSYDQYRSHYQSNKTNKQLPSGPIDNAFTRAFVFVAPTGKAAHPVIDAWVKQEMMHQVRRWREIFRGDVTVINDSEIKDIQELLKIKNVVLWGDASSNRWIAQLGPKFPITWNKTAISAVNRATPLRNMCWWGFIPVRC